MTRTFGTLILIQSFRDTLMIITRNSSGECNLMDVSRGLLLPCFSNKDQRKLNENIEFSTYYSFIYITTVFIIYLILLMIIIFHETYKVRAFSEA